MKTLTTRSATLAACTALLVAGTAGPASAAGTDEPSGSNIVVKGDSNNVAGNDLLVGDNNTSGTGHTVTTPRTGVGSGDDSVTVTVNVVNCSSHTLFYDFSTITGAFTRFPPNSIPPHQGTCNVNSLPDASWTQQGSLFTVGDVVYGVDRRDTDIDFSASIGSLNPATGVCRLSTTAVNCEVLSGGGAVNFFVTD